MAIQNKMQDNICTSILERDPPQKARLSKKSKARFIILLSRTLAAMLSLIMFCGICASCKKPDPTPEPPLEPFDAVSYYEANTVEIMAVGAFGVVRRGTGIIISGAQQPIIATNYHIAGSVGSLISVRFKGETDFVNASTIDSDNLVDVLAFDKYLDLCILKVDYRPTTIYNDLTKIIEGTQILPLPTSPQPTSPQLIPQSSVQSPPSDPQLTPQSSALTTPSTPSELADLGASPVISLGNRNGEGIIKLEGNIVSNERIVTTEFGVIPLIQTTIDTAEGCSGGAMFDKEGRLLGVMSYDGGLWGENYSFAVSADFLCALYNEATELYDLTGNQLGEIDRAQTTITFLGEELSQSGAYIYFETAELSLKITQSSLTVSYPQAHLPFWDAEVISLGGLEGDFTVTKILLLAMRYSANGTGEHLKVTVQLNNTQHQIILECYKEK